MDFDLINNFADCIGKVNENYNGQNIKVGVDLGTANICIAVLDENNTPITGEIYASSVVKDGLVVDYSGAVFIVKNLKEKIENRLGKKIYYAAGAVPPGTVGKNASIVSNIIEAANMDTTKLVDEPEAAAVAMSVTDGAVVDIGGGTTGVSIIRNSKVVKSYDEPTGGTHMTLVLSGHYGISIEDAEKMKLENPNQVFSIIQPVAEKMARIVSRFIKDFDTDTIYLTGGAASFDGMEKVFFKECNKKIIKPQNGLYVTPIGIAMMS